MTVITSLSLIICALQNKNYECMLFIPKRLAILTYIFQIKQRSFEEQRRYFYTILKKSFILSSK